MVRWLVMALVAAGCAAVPGAGGAVGGDVAGLADVVAHDAAPAEQHDLAGIDLVDGYPVADGDAKFVSPLQCDPVCKKGTPAKCDNECGEQGMCHGPLDSLGLCQPMSDTDCLYSYDCWWNGNCHLGEFLNENSCIPTSDADCRHAIYNLGRLYWDGQIGCLSKYDAMTRFGCIPVDGKCQ